MAGSTPFFVTAATTGDAQATTKPAGKRGADALHSNLLQSSLEDLTARGDEMLLLGEIRDVLVDHMLETVETELKYTVLFVCEDVPDFWPEESRQLEQPEQPEHASPSAEDVAASTDATSEDIAPSSDAASQSVKVPFLTGLDGGYQFVSRLSEGDSIPRCDATLLRVPVSKREMEKEKRAAKKAIKKKIKKFKKGKAAESGKPSADFYVLSPDELKLHLPSIPFTDPEAAAEFMSTRPLVEGETRPPERLLLALDCEMCRTTKGVELTRLTLVDASEKVLLDEYVRPLNPIVDYCTQYSGITCDIMEATSMRLADIQQRFLALVPAEAILVGHSIENDLLALRVLHHRVIDTTSMYPHPKGLPFRSALRFLTSRYLHRAIQTGTDGHCSVEDAVATLQLAQLKIKHGPTFPSLEHEYKEKKVLNELARAKKSALIVDSQRCCRSLSAGVACVIPREEPEAVAQTVVHQLTTGFPPQLTWARVRGATRAQSSALAQQIRAQLPANACLVVVLSGDTSALRALHTRRTARSDKRSSLLWDKPQQDALAAEARRAQTGLVHVLLA